MPSDSLLLKVCQGELSYRNQVSRCFSYPFSQQALNPQKVKSTRSATWITVKPPHPHKVKVVRGPGGWSEDALLCYQTSTTALDKSLQADTWKKLPRLNTLLNVHRALSKSTVFKTFSTGTSAFHLVLAGSSSRCSKSHVRWTLTMQGESVGRFLMACKCRESGNPTRCPSAPLCTCLALTRWTVAAVFRCWTCKMGSVDTFLLHGA